MVNLCYLELAGLLFYRGGVGCLSCLDFYFLEVDPAELWAASAVGPRGKLARGSFSPEIVCAARLLKETNTICQAQTLHTKNVPYQKKRVKAGFLHGFFLLMVSEIPNVQNQKHKCR